MDEGTGLRIRHAFGRLREGGTLTEIDMALMEAFERLMHGLAEVSDGSVTVVNLCVEAGVSRASYYRSPVAAVVKEILAAPQTRRPEAQELRTEITQLKKQQQDLRRRHAAEVRELKDTVTIYANQIQALALRNAELEKQNVGLAEHLERVGVNVTVLPLPRRAAP